MPVPGCNDRRRLSGDERRPKTLRHGLELVEILADNEYLAVPVLGHQLIQHAQLARVLGVAAPVEVGS